MLKANRDALAENGLWLSDYAKVLERHMAAGELIYNVHGAPMTHTKLWLGQKPTERGMTYDHLRSQYGNPYGLMDDAVSRSLFRSSADRDADEGMIGHSGESGNSEVHYGSLPRAVSLEEHDLYHGD